MKYYIFVKYHHMVRYILNNFYQEKSDDQEKGFGFIYDTNTKKLSNQSLTETYNILKDFFPELGKLKMTSYMSEKFKQVSSETSVINSDKIKIFNIDDQEKLDICMEFIRNPPSVNKFDISDLNIEII